MHSFDPYLLRYARSARGPITVTILLGTLAALLALAQVFSTSAALSLVVSDTVSLIDVWPFIVGIAAVFARRALIVAAHEVVGTRVVAAAVKGLRGRAVDATATPGSRWGATKGAETTTLLSTGLEDLRPYFVSFLPQLAFVCTVTPAALGVILLPDFWSVLIAFLVTPLIPIFMILIGRSMRTASEDKFASVECLTAQLPDLMSGLPILHGLGREKVPCIYLHALGAADTKTTTATLCVAFPSGGMFEFLTTLSVVLVTVEVGMRLVFGNISLFHGLAAIMLAPEVFDPLRRVGAQLHASANGVTAPKTAFDIIEEAEAVDSPGTDEYPDMARTDTVLDGLGVRARGAWTPTPMSGVIALGIVMVLCGPSGMEKSTIVLCLLVGMTPGTGRVPLQPSALFSESGEFALLDINPTAWHHQISQVLQSPTLVPGTILDNMGDPPPDDLNDATMATGLDDVSASVPDGWNTVIGSGGAGLSVGQRQRLALTRALAVHSQVVILDEPIAHLDAVSEETVVRAIDATRDVGRTVIVIAHHATMMEVADAVIDARPAADEEARA